LALKWTIVDALSMSALEDKAGSAIPQARPDYETTGAG
jgi:hypothetical protein